MVFHSDTMRALGVVIYSDTGVPGAVFHSDIRSPGTVFHSDKTCVPIVLPRPPSVPVPVCPILKVTKRGISF